MPFQIREFQILFNEVPSNQDFMSNNFQLKNSYPDIYVYKKGAINIGVKFRDIQSHKYGYKINSVQIKVDHEALANKTQGNLIIDEHYRFFQEWKKLQVKFKYRLMKPSAYENLSQLLVFKQKQIEKAKQKQEDQTYIEQLNFKYISFKFQLEHLNKCLTSKIRNYICKKSELKSYLFQENFLNSWLSSQNPIKELFVINKNKIKTKTWQTGKLLVQTFSGNLFKVRINKGENEQAWKIILIETISQEGKNKSFIQSFIDPIANKKHFQQENQGLSFEQIYKVDDQEQNIIKRHKKGLKYKWNVSYPQLLQDLYRNLLVPKKQ